MSTLSRHFCLSHTNRPVNKVLERGKGWKPFGQTVTEPDSAKTRCRAQSRTCRIGNKVGGRSYLIGAGTEGREWQFPPIIQPSCLSPLAHDSASTKSPARSARAAWARSIGRRTRRSGGRWRSRSCRTRSRPTLTAWRDSSGEARILASLNHPNIATIYGVERSAGLHALVMELVEGDDLSQRIARGVDPDRRSGADRAADRRGARGRARTGDDSP